MTGELSELEKYMFELKDEVLLRIVEVDYADYRQDAIYSAKRELTSRGISFQEPPTGGAFAEQEEEPVPVYRELETVAIFSTPYEASLAKGLLETNDIPAFIANEHMVGMNWLYSNAIGGVKVQVAATNTAQARELLAHGNEVTPMDPELDEDWGNCPDCGSKDVVYFTAQKGAALLSLVLIGIPLLFPTKKLHCLNCDHIWDYKPGWRTTGLIKVALFGWMLLIVVAAVLAVVFPSLFGDDTTGFLPIIPSSQPNLTGILGGLLMWMGF